MKNRPSEDVIALLQTVIDEYDKAEQSVRERQLRTWKRLKLSWEGFSRTWYSEVAHDWRVFDAQTTDASSTDQAYYDKPINVLRAYLESIIAAISVTIPPIKCYPDDADNPLDISTAKGGDKIAQLIHRHNDVNMFWLHGMFIYCTEGMVACYNFTKTDKAFGTFKNKKYKDVEEEHELAICPLCQHEMSDKLIGVDDEFDPGEDDVALHDIIFNEEEDICPNCMMQVSPELRRSTFVVTRLVGVTDEVKSRVGFECYGGLNVRVPNWVQRQEDTPYLGFDEDVHYSVAIERYPELYECFKKGQGRGSIGAYDLYEQWARLNPQYLGEYPLDNVTIRKRWLRPMAFNVLDKKERDKLRKLYPDGAYVTYVNDEFACACNESLDDHWTLTKNPMSNFLQSDPLALLLISVQEITNDLISLVLQTIEHGIPQTFADPSVVNFDGYAQLEATPGGITPVKTGTGKAIGEAFYEVKTASLSPETLPFGDKIQQLGQLASGASPTLFGGALAGGGDTASEYSMSKAQAQQRVGNIYKIFLTWWKTINSKLVPQYIKLMQEDEREVQQDKQGNFINVMITKAELEGRLGRIELEASDNLPLTWGQRKDVYLALLQNPNEQIQAMLMSPENIPVMKEALGLIDMNIPGEDDRQKQFEEIQQLLLSEPIMESMPDPMTGQDIEIEFPSVEIDEEIDNHQVEFEIARYWLISDVGRQTKVNNPPGYKNVLLHAKMHRAAMIQGQMDTMATEEDGEVPAEKPTKSLDKRSSPITEEADVQTV